MHILLLMGLAIACVFAAYTYWQVRPGLGRLRDGLNVLAAYGRDQAEIRFIHTGSGREIVFRKEIVGGVQQLLLVTQALKLNDEEQQNLRTFLKSHDLELETRRKSKRSKAIDVVSFGHSAAKAADITTKLAGEILKLSPLARFKFDFDYDNFNLRRPRT